MEIRQIQYFLAIVESGSFSLAAEEFNISQSSLSKRILSLEKELGLRLFDRSHRQLSLTDTGKIFLRHAMSLNEAYKIMLQELGEYKTVSGSFSIVSIPVITQYGITSYIVQFKDAYPDIDFTLDEREGMTILPALTDKQFDLGFVRDNYIDKNLFSILEICKDKLVVLVSHKHRLSKRNSISLSELSNENFIMFDKGAILHNLSVDECKKAGFEPQIFYSSLHIESILGLVASNIGIALMAKGLFDHYRNPDVVPVTLKEEITSNVVLAYLKRKKLPKAARIFVEFMKMKLATNELETTAIL